MARDKDKAEDKGGGGNWIMTFADMVTLLLAGFIIIVTFSSRDVDQLYKRNDSLIGKGSSGITGKKRTGPEKDSVVLRPPPRRGRPFSQGSETPALFSDPPEELKKAVQAPLEAKEIGDLSDSFEFEFPIGGMFDSTEEVSTHGKAEFDRLANTIRKLPYDLTVQVADDARLGYATGALQYLFKEGRIHPARISIGLRPRSGEGDPDPSRIWVTLRRVR